jgi:uncharacterized RDD family membrane protein YckC
MTAESSGAGVGSAEGDVVRSFDAWGGTRPPAAPSPWRTAGNDAAFQPEPIPSFNYRARPARPTPARTPESASMGNRLVALIIDGVVLGLPLTLLGWAIGMFDMPIVRCDTGSCTTTGGVSGGVRVLFYILELVVSLGYYGYFDGLRTRTIGKQFARIAVIDERSGGAVGFGRSILRQFVLLLSGLALTAGYWSPYLDKSGRLQGWHDMVARTIVVARPVVQARPRTRQP